MIEIRQLRYFWMVAQEQNITRAAKLLHISQPTLSRQIRELEEDIGVALFNRENNQLSLTEDGAFLKERAEEILALDDKLSRDLAARRNENLSGKINIGCVEGDNSETVAMILEELLTDYPDIVFDLITGTSEDTLDRLEKGILDLALLIEPVNLKKVQTLTLPRKERWGFIVAKDIIPENKTNIIPTDLLDMPLLISNRNEIQNLIAKWAGIDAEDLNPVGTFNLISNVLPLVRNHLGAAFVIEGAVSGHIMDDTLFLPLEPAITSDCIVAWKDHIHIPPVQELISRFKHAF